MGGHLQELSKSSIKVRVPAASFETAVSRMEQLGDVADRAISGTDVTEQFIDLDIRLGNLEKSLETL